MSGLPDTLVHRVRPAAGEPEGAMVLLHGRGADENDLFPFFDILDPERRLVGVTPGGPLFLPPGGRHWYIVPRVGYPEPRSFLDTYQRLDELLGAMPGAFGVPSEQTIIGGFSQGTVMSYALGLGRGRPSPAGIIAMSGFIPTVEGWDADLDRPGLPVWISHGRQDPVISVQFARDARDLLTSAGVDVSYHESDVGHQVDPQTVAQLPGWVADVIARAQASA
ncbi:MAG: phospholipase/carboxylesterase [Solirubrobacteraceae bacterium]|nr:phospholipase/carboxylesterase [Solirubrobacteraceae bacterium]